MLLPALKTGTHNTNILGINIIIMPLIHFIQLYASQSTFLKLQFIRAISALNPQSLDFLRALQTSNNLKCNGFKLFLLTRLTFISHHFRIAFPSTCLKPKPYRSTLSVCTYSFQFFPNDVELHGHSFEKQGCGIGALWSALVFWYE